MRYLCLGALLLAGVGTAAAPKGVRASLRAKGKAPRAVTTPVVKSLTSVAEVTYVTATLAYLNRGSADGVSTGTSISLTRAARAVGTCIVDSVSEHWATCPAGALRKGDTFALARKAVDTPGPSLELASARELGARHDALMASEQPLVEFDVAAGGFAARHVAVTLGHTTYANLSSGGPFQMQRLDASVYDVDFFRGLRASADVSVLNFSSRPTGFRSVYGATPVLLVRQLEVGFRRDDVPFSAALGRVWTRSTPGLLVVDGAQGSFRFGDWLETGLYGGLLPNDYTLTLQTRQWTAGAFFSAKFLSGRGADSTLVQTEARVGYAVKDSLGGRLEVGAGAHVYAGRLFDGHLGLELAYGGASQAVAGIDAARLDVGFRPGDRFRLVGGVRYRGGSPAGQVELGLVSPGQRAVHADGTAVFEAAPFLWLGVQGGVASDFASLLTQSRVGPELTLPTLLGRSGGLTVGYAEEFGWMRARHAYVQAVFSVASRVRVLTRTSWFSQLTTGLAANEVAQTVNLDVTLFRWLWARASLSGRTQLEDVGAPSRTAGLVSIQMGGGF